MADERTPAAEEQVAPAVIGVSQGPTKEYSFGGHPDETVGDEVFHRSAGTIRKGEKVMLSAAHAAELREAGFKVTEKKT